MASRRPAKRSAGAGRRARKRADDGRLLLVALLVAVGWLAWSGVELELPPAANPTGGTTSSRDDVAPPRDGPPGSEGEMASAGASGPSVAEILERIAAARGDEGLPPLGQDPGLMAAAQSHGNAMAATGRCAHEGRGLEPLEDRLDAQGLAPDRYGEILACGAADADEALQLWQRSPDHRTILLDPGYTEVGVGVAPDGEGGWYWTAVFAAGL